MSAEVDRIKKLVIEDQIVAAAEIPPNHRNKPMIVDDLEEVLSRFDDDGDFAHFIVRVRRSKSPLSTILPSDPKDSSPIQTTPQISIDAMVNETLEAIEQPKSSSSISSKNANSAQVIEQLSKENDYDPDFLIENARILEESGDSKLARNIYQSLIKKGARIPQALWGLARTYEKENLLEKAVRCYQEAIAYSSELPFYQAMAALQIRMGNDYDAIRTIVHALGLNDLTEIQQFELHKTLGNCYTRSNEFDKAEHHYKKAYELNPKSDTLQVNVGSLALQKNDLESAKTHFERAIELNEHNDKAISGLGMVALASGNNQVAHDYFIRSLNINLNNLASIYNLVKCAYDIKKFDAASSILEKYIQANPVNTNILYSYAGILFHQDNLDQAALQVSKILETNQNHAGAKELTNLIEQRRQARSQVFLDTSL